MIIHFYKRALVIESERESVWVGERDAISTKYLSFVCSFLMWQTKSRKRIPKRTYVQDASLCSSVFICKSRLSLGKKATICMILLSRCNNP